MKPIPPFVITSFTNPSGDVVFRVSGWLDGKRIRKNFSTRVEADAERQVLEVQRAQGETGIRTAITRLSYDQIGEAETLFARAQGMPRPLAFYLDFAFANYREPQTRKLLSDAVVLYTAAKDHEFKQDQISSPQLERIKRDLKRLQKHFPKVTVAELTADRLIAFQFREDPKALAQDLQQPARHSLHLPQVCFSKQLDHRKSDCEGAASPDSPEDLFVTHAQTRARSSLRPPSACMSRIQRLRSGSRQAALLLSRDSARDVCDYLQPVR